MIVENKTGTDGHICPEGKNSLFTYLLTYFPTYLPFWHHEAPSIQVFLSVSQIHDRLHFLHTFECHPLRLFSAASQLNVASVLLKTSHFDVIVTSASWRCYVT